ncbi:MAG: hypothetical protein WBD63_12240 [Phycisphaerae bacterium]|nr:hypothetical protein [Phycisphaerae bacterium]
MKSFTPLVMVLVVLAAAAVLQTLAGEREVLAAQSTESQQAEADQPAEVVKKLAERSSVVVLGEVTAVHDGTARDAGMSYDIKVVEILKGAKVLEIFKGKHAKGTLHFRSAGWVGYARYSKGEKVLLFLYYWVSKPPELLQLKPITYVAEEEQPERGLRIWPLEQYLALVRGNSAAACQSTSAARAPAPLASLSHPAREIVASMEPDWTLTDCGRYGRPPGWSGETDCEYLTLVLKEPPAGQGPTTYEIWLSPGSYRGDRLPFLVDRPGAAWLHSVGDDRLLFLRTQPWQGENSPLLVNLSRTMKESFGFQRTSDRERTPESLRSDPVRSDLPAGWSAKTKEAVQKIRPHMESTQISVDYIGPRPEGFDYSSILFQIYEIPMPVILRPGEVCVYLPCLWRARLVDCLADDGFFDRATDNQGILLADPSQGSRYVLSVRGNGYFYAEDLGWNAETGRRLDALRKALVGDAAVAMDTLLERLGPQRKEWERAARPDIHRAP